MNNLNMCTYLIFMCVQRDIKGTGKDFLLANEHKTNQTIKNEILGSRYSMIFIMQNVQSFFFIFSKTVFLEMCFCCETKQRNG